MQPEIPLVIEMLYRHFVTAPNPDFWPEYFQSDPVMGHSLWSFYQGIRLGIQLADARLEKQ